MSVASIMTDEIRRKGIQQRDLAHRVHCDPSAVSRLLSGRRPAISPVVREIARQIGSAKAWLALVDAATDGLFTAPWPDGPIASTDPQAVYLKLGEEAAEAQESLHQLIPYLTRKAEAVNDEDRERIEDVLLQVLDLIRCAQILLAAACDAYAIDVVALHRRHDEKLVKNGTISVAAARRAA